MGGLPGGFAFGDTMIRPDGKPLHHEDGWESDGCPLTIATCPSVRSTHFGAAKTIAWARLMVPHKATPSKEGAILWSPVILGDMARRSSSVTHVTALVYDFDNGALWEDTTCIPLVAGMRYWAYTTHSHTPEHHKFRLVLAVDEAIPIDLYPVVWRGFARMIGWQVDQACKDPARLYYTPSCPLGSDPWQDWADGIGLPWRDWLPTWQDEEARMQAPATRSRRIDPTERDRTVLLRTAEIVLQKMSPACGMANWWAICCGVTDALGREGFEMVRSWSQGAPDKFRSREWQSMERRFNV